MTLCKKTGTSYTYDGDLYDLDVLLESHGCLEQELFQNEHSRWLSNTHGGVFIILYPSGTILLQGTRDAIERGRRFLIDLCGPVVET